MRPPAYDALTPMICNYLFNLSRVDFYSVHDIINNQFLNEFNQIPILNMCKRKKNIAYNTSNAIALIQIL